MSLPVYSEALPAALNVAQLLRVFEREPFLLVFDGSAGWTATSSGAEWRTSHGSRYSILTADPIETCVIDHCNHGDDPFTTLRKWQLRFSNAVAEMGDHNDRPPFFGGIAGLMSYELGQAFERLPVPERNRFTTPPLVAGLFDWAIVHDHLSDGLRLLVIRLDDNTLTAAVRQTDRIRWIHERLPTASGSPPDDTARHRPRASVAGRPEESSETRHAVERLEGVKSNFTRIGYEASVRRVIDYIAAGDIFQANLSQQLRAAWNHSAVDLFQSVRLNNAAPYCALMRTDDFAIVSASPEQFLHVQNGRHVVTRPIKGTRRRLRSPIADLYTSAELLTSEKDRAENVMIVDLLRNDISRVCRTGSVRVTGVCEVEVFETVQHLVSTIVGELRNDRDIWDLCAACFPGGSITGAPKIRAMEIIAELEQAARGAYCGSLFYWGPGGDFDSSILIRTFTLQSGEVQFPVGGGVVADSIPREEYEETLHKASGMMNALRGAS